MKCHEIRRPGLKEVRKNLENKLVYCPKQQLDNEIFNDLDMCEIAAANQAVTSHIQTYKAHNEPKIIPSFWQIIMPTSNRMNYLTLTITPQTR